MEPLRPEEGGTTPPSGVERAPVHPGTRLSCTPIIMKKVRVRPVGPKDAKRSSR
jgi:hypothetical protein